MVNFFSIVIFKLDQTAFCFRVLRSVCSSVVAVSGGIVVYAAGRYVVVVVFWSVHVFLQMDEWVRLDTDSVGIEVAWVE